MGLRPRTRAGAPLQIPQTDLHMFPRRISWENLNVLKDQSISPLVISLSVLMTFSLDFVWILIDFGHYMDGTEVLKIYFYTYTLVHVFAIKCFFEFVLLNAIRYNCINQHFCSFTVLFQPLLTTLWQSFLEQMPAWTNLKGEPRRLNRSTQQALNDTNKMWKF